MNHISEGAWNLAKQKNSYSNTYHDDYTLIINDMQNGFMNENTDYLPSTVSSFIASNPFHIRQTIMTRIVGDAKKWPQDRTRKAGIVRALGDEFNGRLVNPFPMEGCSVVTHESYTKIDGIIDAIRNDNILLCGLETDSIIILGANLRDAGYNVSIIYDLTATTLGTGAQIAMMGIMQHIFGTDKII